MTPAPGSPTAYVRRVVDGQLDELVLGAAAISIEGAKGVGKTATALQRARSVVALDDPQTRAVIAADPGRALRGTEPILLDEWQRLVTVWDQVRRAVDSDNRPGRFLLTGSATPSPRATHSGAGRILSVHMRPLTLPERGTATPTVSLAELLEGSRPTLDGETRIGLEDYVHEILTGGFPGMRAPTPRLQRQLLDGYLARIVDAELPEVGIEVRHPGTLRRWMTAYAAATATSASYERIRDAATAGLSDKPAKTTTIPYREALERLWILEPLEGWLPSRGALSRLTQAPTHHLADPALAARLLGVDAPGLLTGRSGTLLGALFESLATLSVRVFAQNALARVAHLRTRGGEHEIDLIVEGDDGRVLALEVKLSASVTDDDLTHLRWLAGKLGDDLVDALVITTGRSAYRRTDGIGVVPLALLGP